MSESAVVHQEYGIIVGKIDSHRRVCLAFVISPRWRNTKVIVDDIVLCRFEAQRQQIRDAESSTAVSLRVLFIENGCL